MQTLKIENGKIKYEPRPITHEELQREFNCFAADQITKKMLEEGLITQDEYRQIRQFMLLEQLNHLGGIRSDYAPKDLL